MNKAKIIYIVFVMLSVFICISSVKASECSEKATNEGECVACGSYEWDYGINKCVYNDKIYDNFNKELVSCGNGMVADIPKVVPKVISILYTVIQILVPILLVIFGSIDLVKGIIAQKDDEIKKGQQILIKRLIVAIIVFFVFAIVKFVISIAADSNAADIIDCTECFISNDCD